MVVEDILIGESIYLRQITLDDCTDQYVAWLNDPDVNRFLETKWSIQNMDSIKSFVSFQRDNEHSILFAIVTKVNDEHIGNMKIGPIHPYYSHADISYFIGEKTFWQKGIATEAIKLVCDYGFDKLSLNRIEAGAYESAIGSWKALEKCGFVREGVFRKQVIFNSEYIDVYRYGLLKDERKA